MKRDKLIILNSLTLFINFMIMMTFLSKSIYSLYASFILLLITFIVNIKSNKSFFIQKKISLFLVFLSMISLLLPLYNSNFFSNIKITILVLASIILLFLCIMTQKNRNIILKNTFKFFAIFTEILVIYGFIIYIFGEHTIYSIDQKNMEYFQKMTIGGIELIQSACGDLTKGYYVGSLTNNPNALSFICIFSLIYILFFCKRQSSKILSISILFLGVLISGSRLATILFPLVIIVKCLLDKTNSFNGKKKLLMVYLIFTILLIFLLNFTSVFNSIDYNGRLENWEIGMHNIRLIGHGINSDNVFLSLYLNHTTSMHNSYISLFVNYGIIFAIIILLVFFKTLCRMFFSYNRSNYTKFTALFFLTLMIISFSESVFLIYSSFNNLFFYIIYYYYLEGNINDNNIYT